ncbi:DUF5059 domain-containing protein [Halostella litorea]|uniref:DUF5059 domain-containing protein n=1 Tax=Halostella litorea TaxID=2528831 RepID=UPI001091B506|nr:DUF5059 domain-containing protein [Halostella litorea]
MERTRRTWLKGSGAVLAGLALAGCSSSDDGSESTTTDGTGTSESDDDGTESEGVTAVDAAVGAEWNAMRARVWDALALGRGGYAGAGATVAEDVFARFENAAGENNAHEALEAESEDAYHEFEEALGELRTEGLEAGDVGRASEEAAIATTQLAEAQGSRLDEGTARAFDLQTFGAALEDAAVLAATGAFDAAATVAEGAVGRFEDSAAHDALESADGDAYERFESAASDAVAAAGDGDAGAVRSSAADARAAAVDGSYALASSEAAAGAGHVASFQARGWNAAALAGIGGPSTAFAHASVLSGYRARVHDAAWLFDRGQPDAAARVVENVFAHFEGARAHEALESADEEAYHAFEDEGLDAFLTAVENGDAEGVASAVETVDGALVSGIEALGSGVEPALLEAGFFRARIADAVQRYHLGEGGVAADVASGLLEAFEANEADFHETLESTDESLYHAFEDEHLTALIDAFEQGEDAAVEEHAAGVDEALLSFETMAGSQAQVSGVESTYVAARAFDADVLAVLGADERAESAVSGAFSHFEGGAGGFHEALEAADRDRYESFEGALSSVGGATAADGESVAEAARAFHKEAVGATYAVVAAAGGSYADAAATVAQDAFADFESARVHELLESADGDAYEGFEAALEEYVAALESGSGVDAAAAAFADAALRAQFAVAGAPDAAPVDGSGEGGGGTETDLSGGPNVVEGVPDDADHVVDMTAVAFEPTELTVAAGDTVAWTHAGGEPHSVTAVEDDIPDDATYWASGGFEGESAARDGWESGEGAVQSGQSYVHTFETTGEHAYVCIPHEAAGMTGTVVVE